MITPQVTERDKQADFIENVRAFARKYTDIVQDGRGLLSQWYALYSTIVDEADCEVGTNIQIVPNPTRKQSVADVLTNTEAIIASFDAGVKTNMARIAK